MSEASLNISGRETISLNGIWQVIIDPYETGYYDYRGMEQTNGYFKNRKAANKQDLVEYDFDKSETLVVPGDWNSQKCELLYYEGTIWYKKSFNYAKRGNKRVFIHFGAVNYKAIVYLNGEKIGSHEGGFTPFSFEITGNIKNGDNFVVVKVDNKRIPDGIPTTITDWWNYGGITRDVSIIETPMNFIKDYTVIFENGNEKNLNLIVYPDGYIENNKIDFEIPELKIKKTIIPDKTGKYLCKIKLPSNKIDLWSPETPVLYKIKFSTSTDSFTDFIGLRTIESKNGEIYLNGKPIILNGICIHEEAPSEPRRAYSKEDAETLMGWAKELNCNFVRLAHYPHNENMVRTADKMGILVWEEIPVYWAINWKSGDTFKNACRQMNEMISRDKNRPSVIIWSIGNETPVKPERLEFMSNLSAIARENDSTRLIAAALEKKYIDENTVVIDDPLGKSLDVIGCNEYIGWYEGKSEKCKTMKWETRFEKPVIISEFGGSALYGLHGDSSERWTEEFQEEIYIKQLEMLEKISFVKGFSPWILKDFRSPRRNLPGIQDKWNRKGIISDKGERKKAFYVLKKFYEKK